SAPSLWIPVRLVLDDSVDQMNVQPGSALNRNIVNYFTREPNRSDVECLLKVSLHQRVQVFGRMAVPDVQDKPRRRTARQKQLTKFTDHLIGYWHPTMPPARPSASGHHLSRRAAGL